MRLKFIKLTCCAAISFIFTLMPFGPVAGQTDMTQSPSSQRIRTPWVDVEWISYNPEPVTWRVNAASHGKNAEWFSLLVPTADK